MVLASNQLGSWSTSPFLWGRMGDNNNTSTVLTLGSSIPAGTYTAYLTFFNGSTNASSLGNGFFGPAQRVSSVNFVVTSTADSTPSAFNVGANQTSGINSTVTTLPFTPVGYNTATQISVTGGVKYSLGTGAFTSSNSNISPGQSVRLQYITGSAFSTPVTTTITIGGVDGTNTTTNQSNWIVTTIADPGTGSGGTNPVTGSYGLQLFNDNSNVIYDSSSKRQGNFIIANQIASLADGQTTGELPCEDMTANNTTDIGVLIQAPTVMNTWMSGGLMYTVTRLTNKFKITNNSGKTQTIEYVCVRY
jgi:hypothetical protein